MDSDLFCNKCGARVVKPEICPDCGTVLRDGTKFCHKCGRLVDNSEPEKVRNETLDIPIDLIERKILSSTVAEIHLNPPYDEEEEEEERAMDKKSAKMQKSGKRKVYEDEEDYEEDYEDEYEDDYEDENDYEEESGPDILTIMTAVIGCILLLVVGFLAFKYFKQYAPKDYESARVEAGEDVENTDETNAEQDEVESNKEVVKIVSNVNVRDNPSTEGTNIIRVAKTGETYECVGLCGDGNWYEIVLEDGTHGYVYIQYVTVE